jgi:TDG/mug DNA glycosylase family protein
VLVGINPSSYAVEVGHYFARPQNRFWPAFSRSRLSLRARRGLEVENLVCQHDRHLPRFGIGMTDLVKVPSAQAAQLETSLFREWAPRTRLRLEAVEPTVIAFQGMMALKPFLRYGLQSKEKPAFGPLETRMGQARLYALPNPSPANASFRLDDFVRGFDELADFIARSAPANAASVPDQPR